MGIDAKALAAKLGEWDTMVEATRVAVEALTKLDVGEGWAAQIARLTLAELTGDKDE